VVQNLLAYSFLRSFSSDADRVRKSSEWWKAKVCGYWYRINIHQWQCISFPRHWWQCSDSVA